MSGIKQIFHERHQKCEIAPRAEYKLGQIKNPAVYSVDRIFSQPPRNSGSRCDEFIFCYLRLNNTGIYLVERKDNHNNNVDKVKQQLQGGATYIQDFLNKDPATDEQPFNFMPVWVSKGLRSSTRHVLAKIKISIRGDSRPVKHINVKDTLPKLK